MKTSSSVFVALVSIAPIFSGCHQPLRSVDGFFGRSPAWDTQPRGEQLYETARTDHPEVEQARARLAGERAAAKDASRLPNPRAESRVLTDFSGRYSFEGGVSFAVPIGGRVGKTEEMYEELVRAAEQELETTSLLAELQVRGILTTLAHVRGKTDILEQVAARSRRFAQIAKARAQSALADSIEVALARSNASRDARSLEDSQVEAQNTAQRAYAIFGRPLDLTEIEVSKLAPVRIDTPLAELERAAEESAPALVLARQQVLISDRKAAVVSAERAPDVFLGPAIHAAPSDKEVSGGLQLGVELPLWSTGRGRYEEALARRRAAQAQYEERRREVIVAVRRIHRELDAAVGQIETLEREVLPELGTAVELARLGYESGKTDLTRLLDVHRAASRADIEHAELVYETHELLLELQEILGRIIE